jgi:hypothetical protein
VIKSFSRVHETTTTTGTSTYVLAGPIPGHLSFASRLSPNDQVWYTATNGTDWETGIGTFQVAGGQNLLERTTIIENSLGNTSRINWGGGTKDVFSCPPGSRLATLTANGKLGGEEVNFTKTAANSLSLVYGSSNDFLLYDNTASTMVLGWQWNYNGSGGKRLRIPQLVYANILDADELRQGGTNVGTAAFRDAHTPVSGTTVSATATTVTLPASESAINDIYTGLEIAMMSGPANGQRRIISAYNGATRTVTVDQAFSPAPTAGGGDTYEITTGPARANRLPVLRSDGRLDPLFLPPFAGASASEAGSQGAVPRPAAGKHVAFLRGDGQWTAPANFFVGGWITAWSYGNTYSVAHGLGRTPDRYWVELECTTSEYGYAVGSRVAATAFGEQGTSRGLTVYATSTNVALRTAANGIAIARLDTTAIGVLTPSNWRIRLMAEAWWS